VFSYEISNVKGISLLNTLHGTQECSDGNGNLINDFLMKIGDREIVVMGVKLIKIRYIHV
jgi:hypothetical protein